METNKQWRPAPKHNPLAPYNRAKLKDARWHTPEEAKAISKVYNKWARKRWNNTRYEYYMEPEYQHEVKLLNKYVGKPFTAFMEAWLKRTQVLRDKGVPLELRAIATGGRDRYYRFYVDENGIVQLNSEYHPERPKMLKLAPDGKTIYVRIKPKLLEDFPYISKLLQNALSMMCRKEFEGFCNGTSIEISKFESLKDNLWYGWKSSLVDYFRRNGIEYNKEFRKIYGISESEHYYYPDSIKSLDVLCDFDDRTEYLYIERGSKEYYRYFAEKEKQKSKEIRQRSKEDTQWDEDILKNNEKQAREKARKSWEKTKNNYFLIPG